MNTRTKLLGILSLVSFALTEDVTVTIAKGKLKGDRVDADMGRYYYAFKGIPYAKPPVKDLRFKVILLSLGLTFKYIVLWTFRK